MIVTLTLATRRGFLILFAALSGSVLFPANAQELKIKDIGESFVRYYSVDEHGGHSQNWDITEDDQGLMYFANTNGVLQFDGSEWKMVYRSDGYVTRSVCNCEGKIYVGGTNDIGVLEPDSLGQLSFHSLISRVPERFRNAQSVWDAMCTQEGPFFRTYDVMFNYDVANDTFNIYPTAKRYFGLSVVNRKAYTWDSGRGLMKFDGKNYEVLVKSSEVTFTGYEVAPYYGDTLILNTNQGFFKVIGSELIKWDIPIIEEIQSRIYKIVSLDKYYALATLGDGVLVIDRNGNLIQHIDEKDGLATSRTFAVYADSRSNVWAATNNGNVVIETNSPFTKFGEQSGLRGSMVHFESTKEGLYVGGYQGIFRKSQDQSWQSPDDAPFKRLSGFDNQTAWVFVKRGDDLLICGSEGLYQIVKDRVTPIYEGNHIWAVVESKDQRELISSASDGKFYYARKVGNRWRHQWQIKGINQLVDFMVEEEDGSYWITDSGTGVFRFRLNEKKDSVVSMIPYGITKGLPDSLGNRVFRHQTGLKFVTRKGVYNYNLSKDLFERDPMFEASIGKDYPFRFTEVPNGDVFFSTDSIGKGYLIRQLGGSFEVLSKPFRKIQDINTEFAKALDNRNLMIANRTGVMHYDATIEKNFELPFKSRISRVVLTANDSLINGGVSMAKPAELLYENNALKFSYSAVYYDEPDQLEFQFCLEGFETEWSAWVDAREKEYTNLPHGSYAFKVRAKNIYGVVSEEAKYSFQISPPWYFTALAYVGYVLIFFVFVWLIVKVYSRKLVQENLKLEHTIAERTQEIRSQKEQAEKDREVIAEQAEKLKELDKVKTRFFSNISHEFRTPLTLIQGPIESVMEGRTKKKETADNLKVAHRNIGTLRRLIDEILDFNKMEDGELQLVTKPVFLESFIEERIEGYEHLAEEKDIHFKSKHNFPEELSVETAPDKLENVLNNLISNAIKHSPKGSTVDLSLSLENSKLKGSIADEGPGIAPEDLDKIFERFYQSTHGKLIPHSSGIGLAYVKEIIGAMNGNIYVESKIDQGTTFHFEIPVVELASADSAEVFEEAPILLEPYQHENNKILLVEDNSEMSEYLQQTLGSEFKITATGNGVEALQKLENENPDLIITDLMMPKMGGMELISKLKENEKWKRISVIVLSAKTSHETKIEALSFGLDDYITKPFSPTELEARVKNLLNNQYERSQWVLENKEEAELEQTDPLISSMQDFITENLSSSQLGVPQLADKVALSERQLTRLVKRATGLTPALFIREVKLKIAKRDLENKKFRSVAQAAYAVGFEKPSHFSSLFAKHYGKKPSEYLI